MSECFLGEIRIFGGNYAPEGWALCNGAPLSVSQNQALYSLIGTTYGGAAPANFQLPDLQGRLPVGQGTNTTTTPPLTARTIGQKGGEETHVLVEAEMPSHSHPLYAVQSNATSQIAGPTMLYGQVQATSTNYGLYTEAPVASVTPTQLDATAVTFTGSNAAHPNVMLSTAVNFIIALLGTYPVRPN
ncbi:phage tail protein [Sphingomonas sp.]|uniref:phage tail protein n=1 Tax=Sphingomonas sp. TaxID=28214 RepID=UPI003B3A3441